MSERLRPSSRTDDGEPKTALISLFRLHFWISPPVTFPQRSDVSGRIIMSRVRMWNIHPPPRWLSPRTAPHLRAGALEPQELGEVVSGRVVDGVLEHLHLLHQGQVVVVWGHLRPRGWNFNTRCKNKQWKVQSSSEVKYEEYRTKIK